MAFHPDKNILFIHIPKNAGKSIEIALGFITEELVLGPSLRSFSNRAAKFLLNLTSNKLSSERLFGPIDYTLCGQHLTLLEIQMLGLLSPEVLKRSVMFAVVRNPYSRALSTYRHFCRNTDLDEFKRFWQSSSLLGEDHNKIAHYRPQKHYVQNLKGEVVVPNILKFESLQADLDTFCANYDLPFQALPVVGKAEEHADYPGFYDDEARELIGTLFCDDLEAFDYQF